MKFGEFTARLALSTETIFVKIEGEHGDSNINPFGAISDALRDYEISIISTRDGEIRVTLEKRSGQMNKNVQKLLEPDLPIIPIVNIEIVADDSFNNQLGHLGYAEFAELLAANGWCLKMLNRKL